MSGDEYHRKGDNQQLYHTNPWLYSCKIGLFAGIIWGFMRWIFYELKFTRETPGFVLDQIFRGSFLRSFWGVCISIAFFVVISILAALLYKVISVKLRGPWPGIGFGFLCWFILFVAVGPWIGITENTTRVGWNTLISELCIFLLWGVFIGYSITFEFSDEASREPMNAQ